MDRLRSHGRCRFVGAPKILIKTRAGTRACPAPGAKNVCESIRCFRKDQEELQLVVYGSPDAQLKETLAPLKPVYTTPIEGFIR